MNRPSFKKDKIHYDPSSQGDVIIAKYDKSLIDIDLSNVENVVRQPELSISEEDIFIDESEIEEAKKWLESNGSLTVNHNKSSLEKKASTVTNYTISPGVTLMVDENSDISPEQIDMVMRMLKN